MEYEAIDRCVAGPGCDIDKLAEDFEVCDFYFSFYVAQQ